MNLWEYKGFKKALTELRRRGGPWQRAAEKVYPIMDALANDPEEAKKLHLTNHGESRIKKAVKYDLGNGCRLVTLQDTGYVFLCYVGDHDDCDKWIEAHRGLTVRAGDDCRPIVTYQSVDLAEPDQRLSRDMGYFAKPLVDLLDERLRDALLDGISYRIATKIAQAEVHIDDDDLLSMVEKIENKDRQGMVFDSLMHLRADDPEAATRRIQSFLGEIKPIAFVAPDGVALLDSPDFQNIRVDSEHYRQLIENYSRNADMKDWMLFMHPDQQKFVDANYLGPTKLSGVSGSGKTCVVVRRALSLAERYPGERILVLTLNRSLALLIDALVDKAASTTVRPRVDVKPFFRLGQELLSVFEPENVRLYDDVTWKSKEHIDEVWREFYRCELNNVDARIMQRLHDSLIARGIDAERYVREEFDWIRSATPPNQRDAYLQMERSGRTYPLDESFRRELLDGLMHWERKMRFVGITDYLGIASALRLHREQIVAHYRCVLVDESQDFGTVEMSLVRQLTLEAENDLFLCGDAAQQVSSKHQNLGDAGVAIPSARFHKLVLNYRNSRQILEIAHGMLVDNLTEQMLDSKDFEVMDPKYANFGGPTPQLLKADNFAQELTAAIAFAKAEAAANPVAKICIAACGYSEHELEAFSQRMGLPLLNGETRLENGQVFISDLENTKGFEFLCMVIVNCSEGIVPYPSSPTEEMFRDLSRLYVAMTRARHHLVISYSGEPSRFLSQQRKKFSESQWTSYLGSDTKLEPCKLPAKLEQLRDVAQDRVLDLTGEAYLYTEHALGCPPLLIEKLRSLVTGKSRIVTGNPAEWRTIGSALHDTRVNLRSRQVFGPEGHRLLRERFEAG